jgi:hypothetical protein
VEAGIARCHARTAGDSCEHRTEKKSLLAPVADAYEPSHTDPDRIFAKPQASLLVVAAAGAGTAFSLPLKQGRAIR